MSRVVRVALAAAGVALAGAVAVVASAPLARSGRLLDAAARGLGRPITADGRRVGFHGGIGIQLSGVRIGEDPEFSTTEPFVSARRMMMRLQLRPLLHRRLVVDRIVIDEPVVRLVRAADGRLNVGSLGRPRRRQRSATAHAPAKRHRHRATFDVALLRVEHGSLRYTAPHERTLALTELSVEVRQPRFGTPVPITASGRLAGHGLGIEHLASDGILELRDHPAYHGTVHGGRGFLGPVVLSSLDAELTWSPPSGEGRLTITDGRLAALRLGGVVLDVLRPFLRGADADRLRRRYPDLFGDEGVTFTSFTGTVRVDGERLRSDDLAITAPSWTARGAGTLVPGGDIDVAVTLTGTPALANDLVGRSSVRAVLVDEAGALRVPLRIGGPAQHPHVSPAPELTAALTRQVLGGSGLEEAANSLIERLLRPKRRKEH